MKQVVTGIQHDSQIFKMVTFRQTFFKMTSYDP